MSGAYIPKWMAVPLVIGGFVWKVVSNPFTWIAVVLGILIFRHQLGP